VRYRRESKANNNKKQQKNNKQQTTTTTTTTTTTRTTTTTTTTTTTNTITTTTTTTTTTSPSLPLWSHGPGQPRHALSHEEALLWRRRRKECNKGLDERAALALNRAAGDAEDQRGEELFFALQ
jgi:hypothetical protein